MTLNCLVGTSWLSHWPPFRVNPFSTSVAIWRRQKHAHNISIWSHAFKFIGALSFYMFPVVFDHFIRLNVYPVNP